MCFELQIYGWKCCPVSSFPWAHSIPWLGVPVIIFWDDGVFLWHVKQWWVTPSCMLSYHKKCWTLHCVFLKFPKESLERDVLISIALEVQTEEKPVLWTTSLHQNSSPSSPLLYRETGEKPDAQLCFSSPPTMNILDPYGIKKKRLFIAGNTSNLLNSPSHGKGWKTFYKIPGSSAHRTPLSWKRALNAEIAGPCLKHCTCN